MKAVINRIVVACSCNNNFLTKMPSFYFAALCNFLFLDKSTKTDRRRGKNDPQAKKFLRVTTNIMTLTTNITIVKRLLRLKLTRMARQLYPLKSSWKIESAQCVKNSKRFTFIWQIVREIKWRQKLFGKLISRIFLFKIVWVKFQNFPTVVCSAFMSVCQIFENEYDS